MDGWKFWIVVELNDSILKLISPIFNEKEMKSIKVFDNFYKPYDDSRLSPIK